MLNKSFIQNNSFQKITNESFEEKQELKNNINNNYKDFLIHYYENQANFLNIWLTWLAIFAGIAGIGIPLVMNASYKEKMHLMDREFKLQKIAMYKLRNKAEETINTLQNNFNNDLIEKISEIDGKVNKTEIFAKVSAANSLFTEVSHFLDDKKYDLAISKLNETINIANDVLQLENENMEIISLLARAYGLRANIYSIQGENDKSIEDYTKAVEFAKIGNDYTLINLGCEELLQVQILADKFEEALKTLAESNFTYINEKTLSLINSKNENENLVKELKNKLYEIRNTQRGRG